MEFFLPSVLLLLIAAAVVFFVLPRFGPFFLAIVSALLLAFGIYKHYSTFGAEYRLSTWQLGLTAYAPYVMISGLLLAIGVYLLYLMPAANASNAAATASIPAISTLVNMPSSNTATNPITAGINKALNTAASVVKSNNTGNSILNTLTGKKNNNKGFGIPFSQV